MISTSLAQRLLQAGFEVAGYDIATDRRENLAQLGGTACATTTEVSERCQEVVLAVFNTEQVKSIIESPDGAGLGAMHVAKRGMCFLELPQAVPGA